MKCVGLILMVTLTSVFAHTEGGPKPLFLKAKCDGKLPFVLLNSFKEAITTSQKYDLIATLDNNGRMGTVLYVQMTCVERNNLVAVASAYGLAKCVGPNRCHMSLDGSSMSALLCDTNGESQCGRELFKELEFYLSTAKPILKLD